MGMGFCSKIMYSQSTETHPHPNPPLEREGIYSLLFVKDIIPDSGEIESGMTVGGAGAWWRRLPCVGEHGKGYIYLARIIYVGCRF
ncbi:hypothetical protein UNDYM_3836 [Undibacterium sp. YM2]|nr:hypothetical protein UNDYM_3836 [Undibacterium sp. YM2]